jgi:pimeloyl-ACP methyl ester carboxylesterase
MMEWNGTVRSAGTAGKQKERRAMTGPTRDATIRPFRIDIPQADLEDLRARLEQALWPDELPGGGDYGVSQAYVRSLADRWRSGYDWRTVEARINRYPQFTTEIDGQRVHFLHVRSPEPAALPLIVTHGWPGSIAEFLDIIDALTDPRNHGADPANAFHLVIPSLPGYGFSGPTREPGWNLYRIAAAWVELMRRLGYERYGAVGNDAGSMISPEIGRLDPDHVVGVHVTQIFSFPSGDPSDFADMTEQEASELATLQWFVENKLSFNTLMAQQPQTLAYAITDSPLGLLAWNAQLLGEDLDPDFALSNVMLYWLTGTAASAARLYFENAHATDRPTEPTTVPLALAAFGGDFSGIRRFAERDHANIVRWTTFGHGGHFAAHKAPDLLIGDIRAFYAGLRTSVGSVASRTVSVP